MNPEQVAIHEALNKLPEEVRNNIGKVHITCKYLQEFISRADLIIKLILSSDQEDYQFAKNQIEKLINFNLNKNIKELTEKFLEQMAEAKKKADAEAQKKEAA